MLWYVAVAANRAAQPAGGHALRRFDGRQAKLIGHLGPATDADHTGTLFVRRVRRR